VELPLPSEPYVEAIGRGAGDALAGLLLAQDLWVHRRVETLDVRSTEMMRRQVSLDFTLPAPLRDALRVGVQWVVPVATLRKQRLRNFDLRDEADQAVPALSRIQNSLLGGAALLSQVSDLLREPPPELVERLLAIVRAPDPQSGRGLLAELEEDAALAAVLDHEEIQTLLSELAENYVLCALVDGADRRRVIKLRYDSFLAAQPSRLAPNLQIRLEVQGAAGVNYHAEVVLPEELRSVTSLLADGASDELFDEDGEADRVSLHTDEIPRDAEPEIVVSARPERRGFPTAAAGVGLVVSAVLAVGALMGDLDAAVAGPPISVLLAASALFAGAVVRADEHRLVAALFAGPRRALVLVGVAAVVAATALAFEVEALEWVWRAALAASLAATVVLVAFQRRCVPTVRRLG
jgi:hypothetical protein